MSEAQKQFIERAGWACVSRLEHADSAEKCGNHALAAHFREAAAKSSEFAFIVVGL